MESFGISSLNFQLDQEPGSCAPTEVTQNICLVLLHAISALTKGRSKPTAKPTPGVSRPPN